MAPEDLQMLGTAYASGEPEQVFRAMWEINLSPGFRADDSRFAAFAEMGIGAARAAAGGPAADARLRRPRHARAPRPDRPADAGHPRRRRPPARLRQRRQIAALIPGARLETLEGVGHMFWWEQPQRSAELIREHALAAGLG